MRTRTFKLLLSALIISIQCFINIILIHVNINILPHFKTAAECKIMIYPLILTQKQ